MVKEVIRRCDFCGAEGAHRLIIALRNVERNKLIRMRQFKDCCEKCFEKLDVVKK